MEMRNMKVCLVALVILVCNQVTAENERTTNGRQAKQLSLSDPEQKYDLELSFPVRILDSDEATNDDGRRERIDQLIQEILSNENLALNITDTLPGTLLDPSSIRVDTSFQCKSGQVVVDDQCVPCPKGTYFDEAEQVCTKCAIGFYNADYEQRACNKCPEGKVTEVVGASSENDCKLKCSAGERYDKVTGLCLYCGYGKYQPLEGQFSCELCGVGLTTRTKKSLSKDDCRPDCEDGSQLSIDGNCQECEVGSYRKQGSERSCKACPVDRTTGGKGSKTIGDCNLPICIPGQYLNATENKCKLCEVGTYQPSKQETFCIDCPPNTSTPSEGATSKAQCTNRCLVQLGEEELCDKNAICLFKKPNDFTCQCKFGFIGNGTGPNSCRDPCDGFCRNNGICLKTKEGDAYCQCAGSFTGLKCAEKSEFAYIAGGIAGAVLFVIVLVLLVWMICVRSARNRARSSEKFAPSVGDMTGSQVNFYYGAPAPYAESIAPSHHGSTYAHYYEDEEDGWGMPNYAYDTYGKNSKIARSNGSLYNAGMYAPQYAPQGEFYDRVGKHTYQPRPEDKSGADTSSESEDDRSRRQ